MKLETSLQSNNGYKLLEFLSHLLKPCVPNFSHWNHYKNFVIMKLNEFLMNVMQRKMSTDG